MSYQIGRGRGRFAQNDPEISSGESGETVFLPVISASTFVPKK
jgi:hypothetical protein